MLCADPHELGDVIAQKDDDKHTDGDRRGDQLHDAGRAGHALLLAQTLSVAVDRTAAALGGDLLTKRAFVVGAGIFLTAPVTVQIIHSMILLAWE